MNRDPKANVVKRVGYQDVPNGGGRDSFEAPEADLTRIKEALKRDAYLAQASLKYTELIMKMGYSLWSKDQTALDYVRQRLEMIEIATKITTDELLWKISKDVVESGNAFLVKARAKGGIGLPPGLAVTAVPPSKEPVAGYFPLPAESMTVARDKNGTILTWQQEIQGVGDPIKLKPEDIVHVPFNSPSGKVFGLSTIAPVLEDVVILRKIEENAALLTRRFAFPTIKYTVGESADGRWATDEEIEDVKADLENADIESIYVMPERHNIEGVSIPTLDMIPHLKYFEARVFTGLGLSAVDFGRGDTANRNTADAMGGIKADRVKAFQHTIMMHFNKQVIEELLVEGGFDPYTNPDHEVEIVFNEIEMEQLIKRETHEMYKFEHNAITFDELRSNLNLDPNADEERLMHNMLGKGSEAETATGETDNKQKPENQSGTRTGPKKATEFKESASRIFEPKERIGRVIRTDHWFDDLKLEVGRSYAEGVRSAGLAPPRAKDQRHLLEALVDGPRERYEKRVAEGDESVVRWMDLHAKMCVERARWFGYAIAHSRNGCESFRLKVEGDACRDCSERDGEVISFKASGQGASMLLLHVPPLHPNGEHVRMEAIYKEKERENK
ncbi:hypothetical protein ACQR3P_28590 [Rhodococcus sp. IEGM1300]